MVRPRRLATYREPPSQRTPLGVRLAVAANAHVPRPPLAASDALINDIAASRAPSLDALSAGALSAPVGTSNGPEASEATIRAV